MHKVDDAANLLVHSRNHRRIGRAAGRSWQVVFTALVGRIIKLAEVLFERILRHLQRQVRHRRRNVAEEGAVFIVADELDVPARRSHPANKSYPGIGDSFLVCSDLRPGGIDRVLRNPGLASANRLLIIPQVRWIIIVGDALVV